MNEFDPITDPARAACQFGQAALQRLLDGELAWDTAEAAAHRAACADCRAELALAHSLVALPRPIEVPSSLTDRVLGAALSARRRRQFGRRVGVSIALAASVLVAVIAVSPGTQTVTESRTVAAARPVDPATPRKPLGQSVAEARDAIVALTRRTAEETRETSTNLIPRPELTGLPEAGIGLEPLSDARAGAALSVEPLANSARRALNLFLRAADPPAKRTVQ